jgi:hypothetical protein
MAHRKALCSRGLEDSPMRIRRLCVGLVTQTHPCQEKI